MFKYFKIYSIDIALGAVVSSSFMAKVIQHDIDWPVYLIIFLTVWSIYTIDHLVDAKKLDGRQGPARYFYHLKYYYPTLVFVIIAMGSAALIAFLRLPKDLLFDGFYIAVAVVIYFLLRLFLKHIFAGLKELVAALVYTAGVSLPAVFYNEDTISMFLMMVVLQFFCIVFANLLICSMWDESWDKTNAYDSMTVVFGRRFINILALSLIAISIISSGLGFFIYIEHQLKIQLVILLMNVGLILVYFYGEKLEENVQRFLIDSIFFIPLLLYFL